MTDPKSQDDMDHRIVNTQEGGSGRKDGKQTLSPECKAAIREVVGAIENGVDLSVLSPSVEAATTACSVEIQGLGAIQPKRALCTRCPLVSGFMRLGIFMVAAICSTDC